jgi:hypothetical protein
LAQALGQKPTSGAFRTKVASAQIFGAVQLGRGVVTLTALGHRLADQPTRPAALAEAFLHVPLYKKLYEKYQNLNLPGDTGLEADIQSLGVVANQADRARQVFQRSAEKAGFFWGGSRDRLVLPPAANLSSSGSAEAGTPQGGQGAAKPASGGGDEVENLAQDPILQGLFSKLPASGDFPAAKRQRWLKALAVNLDLVYGEVPMTVALTSSDIPAGEAHRDERRDDSVADTQPSVDF